MSYTLPPMPTDPNGQKVQPLPRVGGIGPTGINGPTGSQPSTGIFGTNPLGIPGAIANGIGSANSAASNVLDIPKAIQQAGLTLSVDLQQAVLSFLVYGTFAALFVVLIIVFLTDKNPQELVVSAGKTAGNLAIQGAKVAAESGG